MEIKAAVDAFFAEFSKLERNTVGLALRALYNDGIFVEQGEMILGLEARLVLLERMSFARGIPETFMTELAGILLRTRRLCEQRDDLASVLVALDSNQTQVNYRAVAVPNWESSPK